MSEMAKMSLTGDEFDASSDTLTQIWPKKLDNKVLGIVEKSSIGSNVTNKAVISKTQRLPSGDTPKELYEWR